jgi:ABC-type branched-subunit amino acid transport system ATPase component
VLQLVDRLIWLEAGKIMADGPKAEVLKRMSGAAA